MRTFSKKALSLFLCLVFVCGCIIPVSAAGKKFADVKENQWFYSYVDYMAEKKVIQGHDTGLFAPNDNVKRNEFITMVNKVFGLTEEADVSFTDVPANSWYAPFYRAAYKQGYLQKAFGNITAQQPTKELTREEAVALLMAYMSPEIDISNQTLSFTDAGNINPKYKDFILQSVYQGIVVGYDDNTFKPRKTLTRAEAAKILCVAAGTIVTSGAISAPETGVSGNAVINGNGTTLNFNVDGDIIVTEAVDGIVAIRNATINGTVYIRGGNTSSVEFSNCKVAGIVVEGESLVVISGGTSVTNLTLKSQCMIGMTGASVKNFIVAEGAKDSIVRAEGSANAVENYAIYASGFTSQVLHSGSIKFGTGLKATIAGKEYSGSGFAADSLRTSWNSGEEYIHYNVVNDGYVDYFYSGSSSVTSSTFATLYNATAAALKGTKSVSVGQAVIEKTKQASMAYKYIVVAFRTNSGAYEGVKVIDRELELYGIRGDVTATYSSGGFRVKFTVGINDNAHKNWKAYYTFTDNKNLSIADINNISTYKTLTDGTTFKEADAEGKKYIAVFIYENGIVHEPKVAEIPVFYNGFTSVPTVTIKGGDKKDVLSYALPGSGKIRYFYAEELKENYTKNETTFNNEYYAIPTSLKGEVTVYGSGAKTVELKSIAVSMRYVILCVEGHDPVAVTRMYEGTGFAENGSPVAYEIGNENAITFIPEVAGTLKYVYVDSVKSLTTRGFNELYNSTAITLRGEIKGCEKDKIQFASISNATGATKYLAVMLTTGVGTDYQPICITLVDPGTGINSAIFSADMIAETLKFTASHKFGDNVTVSYEAFYIDSTSVTLKEYIELMKIAHTNSLANNMFEQARALSYAFTINADGTVLNGRLPKENEKEVALRLVINGTYYLTPVIINISKFDYGFDSNSVKIKEENGREKITLDLEEAGTIKYYYTNTAPKDAAAFDAAYKNATYYGSKTVKEGESLTGLTMGDNHVYALAGYKYIVFLFADKDGVKRTPQLFIREGSNTTAVKSASPVITDNKLTGVEYELIDIFEVSNVTPAIGYMVSNERLTNIDLDDFEVFKTLNGTGLNGKFSIPSHEQNSKYVYIVVGVARRSTVTGANVQIDVDYKFFPFEIDVEEAKRQG